MNSPRLMTLAAVLLSTMTVPAFAAWDRVGSVEFSPRNNIDTQYGNFGERVEALALQARNSDVTCRNVIAVFDNGIAVPVFHGLLPRGQNVTVDLPGNGRSIRRLEFNCRSMSPGTVSVDISAEVDRYQSGAAGWVTIGTERFEGRNDRDMTFAGWRGRNLDRIAFRPVNDDARCRDVAVTFASGGRVKLNLDNGNVLREGRITTVDLPGNRRDVTRIDISCHAEHGYMATMEVLASR